MEDKGRSPVVRFIVEVLVVAVLAALGLTSGQRLLALEHFHDRMPEVDYLANLRDSEEFSCGTLEIRRPDLVFMGASPGGTDWDFGLIQARLPRWTVGACAMGGASTATLEPFADLLERIGLTPRALVLGVSPHFFMPTPPAQLQHHVRMLEADWPREHARDALLRWLLPWPYPKSHALVEATLARRIEAMATLDDGALSQALADNPRVTGRYPPHALAPRADLAHAVEKFCGFARRHGIPIHVVDLPYADIWWRGRTQPRPEEYDDVLSLFDGCATHIVTGTAAEYGLGVRHYLESHASLRGRITDPARLRDDPEQMNLALDATHLDIVGARVFTEAALARLGLPEAPEPPSGISDPGLAHASDAAPRDAVPAPH